jgi:tRNA (Thr-GGU) A37 N-methylase
VEITAISGRRIQVRHLEALDGTPIIDVKPILGGDISQRGGTTDGSVDAKCSVRSAVFQIRQAERRGELPAQRSTRVV